MARHARVAFDDAIVWVSAQSRPGVQLFSKERDYRRFLSLMQRTLELRRVRLGAWTLLPTEYHLIVRGSSRAISRAIQDVNAGWSRGRSEGGVFRGRYRAVVVEPGAYLTRLTGWVLNLPAGTGLVASAAEWPWSAYRDLVRARRSSLRIAREALVGSVGAPGQEIDHLRAAVADAARENWHPQAHVTGQRFLGGPLFVERMLADSYTPEPRRDFDSLLQEVAAAWGMSAEELRVKRGGDARAVAALLMRERGASLARVGEALRVSGSGASRLASKAHGRIAIDRVVAARVRKLRDSARS